MFRKEMRSVEALRDRCILITLLGVMRDIKLNFSYGPCLQDNKFLVAGDTSEVVILDFVDDYCIGFASAGSFLKDKNHMKLFTKAPSKVKKLAFKNFEELTSVDHLVKEEKVIHVSFWAEGNDFHFSAGDTIIGELENFLLPEKDFLTFWFEDAELNEKQILLAKNLLQRKKETWSEKPWLNPISLNVSEWEVFLQENCSKQRITEAIETLANIGIDVPQSVQKSVRKGLQPLSLKYVGMKEPFTGSLSYFKVAKLLNLSNEDFLKFLQVTGFICKDFFDSKEVLTLFIFKDLVNKELYSLTDFTCLTEVFKMLTWDEIGNPEAALNYVLGKETALYAKEYFADAQVLNLRYRCKMLIDALQDFTDFGFNYKDEIFITDVNLFEKPFYFQGKVLAFEINKNKFQKLGKKILKL